MLSCFPMWLRAGGVEEPAHGHQHTHGGAGAERLDTPAGDGTMSSPAGRRTLERTELPQMYPSKQGEVGSSHPSVCVPKSGLNVASDNLRTGDFRKIRQAGTETQNPTSKPRCLVPKRPKETEFTYV